jgi:predicted 3-demethylubiquinone-9 3-methyltransferase (glyoxalase superfamily)
MARIVPNLWFDGQALEAAEHYCSIFPNSEITGVLRHTEAGPGAPGSILTVDFVLDGTPFTAIDGGPHFTFNEAVSLAVECADQDEIDHYWSRLTDGGEESMCGWLKDRYGVSWQVTPIELLELLGDDDRDRAGRAMSALMTMRKIDVDAVRAAADGRPHADLR